MKSPHVIIKRSLWHYKLFAWSLSVVDSWKGAEGAYAGRYEFGISISRYITTMGSMLFIVVMNILFYIQLWVVFLIIPFGIGGPIYIAYILGVVIFFMLLLLASLLWTERMNGHNKKVGVVLMFRKLLLGLLSNKTPNITFTDGD